MKLFGGFLIRAILGCGQCKSNNILLLSLSNTCLVTSHDCKKELQEISFTGQCVVAIDSVLDGNFIRFESDPSMTREDCRDYCGNYAYFGLRNGNECFCGDDYRLPLDISFDAECPIKCPGDELQSCGGQNRMNLWSQEKSYLFSNVLGDAIVEPRGQCYQDNLQQRILEYKYEETYNNMSRGLCQGKCEALQYKYYGVENGTDCFCGNLINGYPPQVSQSLCDIPCSGDDRDNCGGDLKMNLFTIAEVNSIDDEYAHDKFDCDNWKIAPKNKTYGDPETYGDPDKNWSTASSCFFYNNEVLYCSCDNSFSTPPFQHFF